MYFFDCFKEKADANVLPSVSFVVNLLESKWKATLFLLEMGILNLPDVCEKCGSGIWYKKDPFINNVKFATKATNKDTDSLKQCFIYRCKNRKCNYEFSIFKDTFFANKKKPVNQVLLLLHLWLGEANMSAMKLLTGWEEKTVLQYVSDFRKLVAHYILLFIQQDCHSDTFTYEGQIGGLGVEVQLDESAFGKRKYGLGHHVDTKWVFGGVEITPDANGRKRGGKFFAVVVMDRTRDTLETVMKKFILPGTTIVTDGFKSYENIPKIPIYQYRHFPVNHKKHYKDPRTGACTNTIEGKWNNLKKKIPRQAFRTDEVLQEYLGEQMWRHQNKGHLWEAAIEALKSYAKSEFK